MAVPLSGQSIRASDSFTLTPFTPTWTNVTLGSGAVNEGWYQQIGTMVLWGFRLECGASPAFITSAALVALPVTAFTGGGAALQASLGAWTIRIDANTHYSGSLGVFESAGLNASFAGAWNGTAPLARAGLVSGTQRPGTLAAASVISGSGCYRAA